MEYKQSDVDNYKVEQQNCRPKENNPTALF